jgi:hypothetical protein
MENQTPNGDPLKYNDGTTPKPKMPGGITGKGFVKGDPRCWRKGRPRSFDQVREEAQRIAHEILPDANLTVIQAILRSWAKSKEPMLQLKFVEYGFGKVPDKLETTGLENKTVITLYFDHERGLTSCAGNSKNPRVSSKVP